MVSKESKEYLKNLMSGKSISSTMNPCDEVMKAFDAGVEFEKTKHSWHNVKIELPKESREYLVCYNKECKHSFYVLHYNASNLYEEGSI